MFLFLRLILGHFIGDFCLQTNKIFALKHRGLLGGIPHVLLVTASLLALSWPYLGIPKLLLFILLLGLIHLFQDSLKIKHGGTGRYSFWLYTLDQLSHYLFIAALFFTDLRDLVPPQPNNIFISAYNNDFLITYLIAIIAVTYNGHFLIYNFKLSFLAKHNQYTNLEKWQGMLERTAIVTFLGSYKIFLLLPLLLLMRFLLCVWDKKKRIARYSFIAPSEILLSWGIGLMVGILLMRINQALANGLSAF